MTRRTEVLAVLRAAGGGWVDGSSLATAEVGGSEGLKRLRELRAEGWPIEERRHPDPRRAIWQYRLAVNDSAGGGGVGHLDRRPLSAYPPEQIGMCPDHRGRLCPRCDGSGLVPLEGATP